MMDCDNYTAMDINKVAAKLQIKYSDTDNYLTPAQSLNMIFLCKSVQVAT